MPENELCLSKDRPRTPWNKGKLIGAKPPLRPKHVWSIRTRLMVEGRTRDLAMFNLAIDSKLRGCDVMALKVEDVAPHGYTIDRATVRQKKTGRPVKFELTEQTRQAVDDYLAAAGKKPGEFLFTNRRAIGRPITVRQYARLVSEWIASIGLDPRIYSTHSLRRTKVTLIYRRTGNLRAVQLLLGHTKIDYVPCPTMSRYGPVEPICRTLVGNVRDIAILIAARFAGGQTCWSERVRARSALESPDRIDPTTSSSKACDGTDYVPCRMAVSIDDEPRHGATGHSRARDIVEPMSRWT